jgi:hypothetical protein
MLVQRGFHGTTRGKLANATTTVNPDAGGAGDIPVTRLAIAKFISSGILRL